MYKTILVPLENGPADDTILNHIAQLAQLTGSQLILIHVADGWVARHYDRLNLQPSEEMKNDEAYLIQRQQQLKSAGFHVDIHLGEGEPVPEILNLAHQKNVDLIAMATHGHGLIKDIIYGSTADKLRHATNIPVLMVRTPG